MFALFFLKGITIGLLEEKIGTTSSMTREMPLSSIICKKMSTAPQLITPTFGSSCQTKVNGRIAL